MNYSMIEMSQIENHVLYNVIMLKIIINENFEIINLKRQVGYCVVVFFFFVAKICIGLSGIQSIMKGH